MKKITTLALSALCLLLLFTACGKKEQTKTYNLSDLVSAVEGANPVSNPRAIDDNFILLDAMLTKESIAEYSGLVSNDGGNSALILALKAEAGKADELKAELAAYKENISTGGMYAEFAQMEEMAKDARIVAKGDYLVMVVANTNGADYAQIDKALDEALA